jgi:hypothetical protein
MALSRFEQAQAAAFLMALAHQHPLGANSVQPNPDQRPGPRGYILGKDGVYRSLPEIIHIQSMIGSMRGAPRRYPYGGHRTFRA